MRFLVIIEKICLRTYSQQGNTVKKEYIEGRDYFPYQVTNVDEDMQAYLDALANEKNLSTKAKLEIYLLANSDDLVTRCVSGALSDFLRDIYPIDKVIGQVFKALSKDKSLQIEKYGINYDGCSYKMSQGNLIKESFDLLSHTIHGDDMAELIEFRG